MVQTRIAKLVEFGNGGDTVYFAKGSRCEGYGSPENPHAAAPHDDLTIPDGTPAVDVRPAIETDDGYRWVFKGPLVNVDLPESEVDRCPQPDSLMACAMAGNEFGTLLALQECHRHSSPATAGPLDSVSTGVFVQGWREHGARIGHYQNGAIVWD